MQLKAMNKKTVSSSAYLSEKYTVG